MYALVVLGLGLGLVLDLGLGEGVEQDLKALDQPRKQSARLRGGALARGSADALYERAQCLKLLVTLWRGELLSLIALPSVLLSPLLSAAL
jgi:hypothetical protein